jgi:glycerophosphoryl diester phosphodiesterase
MRKLLAQLITFSGAVLALSCDRMEYFPDQPIATEGTRMIAHRGGGLFDEGNTLEACMYGLKMANGIEVDLQKSSDDDVWLSHSSLVAACGSFKESCFASIPSSTIIAIDTCLGNQINYTRLEQVFAFMSANYPDKYISLDVKAWHPCGVSHINIIHEMNLLAKSIVALTVKYHLEDQVLVESEVGDFLYYIKTHNDHIETYLASLGDFEIAISRALDSGFSGISFHYKFDEPINNELVDLMHRKGLKIQLWTVEAADLEEAKSLNVDFIQTDYF